MRLLLIFILSLLTSSLLAQKSEEVQNLEAKRKAALSEIEATSKLLNQTKTSQKNVLTRLNLINQQISSRKEVVSLLNQEIGTLDKELVNSDQTIRMLEDEYEKKKDKYAGALRKMQLHNNIQDKLIFILSADNLAQTYRRFRYLKEYSEWQKLQAEELIQKQKDIAFQKEKIKQARQGKLELLQTRESETAKLEKEENVKQTEIQELKKQEGSLKDELDKKKRLAQALNKQIESVIAEEIAKSKREAEKAREEEARREKEREREKEKENAKTKESEKTKTKTKGKGKEKEKEAEPEKIIETAPVKKVEETRVAETAGGYAMTKEERTLSAGFVNNKGKLPFPLKGNYKIIGRFGLHQHQDLKNIQVNSNGIDIQTSANNNATSVFNGVVSKIFTLAGSNTVIIIRHGNYLTVYSNLADVYVKAGDTVKTGQSIGKIYTDTEENNATILHFEIWKETSKLNPEDWLN